MKTVVGVCPRCETARYAHLVNISHVVDKDPKAGLIQKLFECKLCNIVWKEDFLCKYIGYEYEGSAQNESNNCDGGAGRIG